VSRILKIRLSAYRVVMPQRHLPADWSALETCVAVSQYYYAVLSDTTLVKYLNLAAACASQG
jgi:hypothetical protein